MIGSSRTRSDLVRLDRKEDVVNHVRSYRSPLRDAQARETRQRVVASARELFVAQGYASTTVAAIAMHASVSTDLVYKAFGSKSGVLKSVLDTTVGGDDEGVAVLDRPGPQAMRAETDQPRQ